MVFHSSSPLGVFAVHSCVSLWFSNRAISCSIIIGSRSRFSGSLEALKKFKVLHRAISKVSSCSKDLYTTPMTLVRIPCEDIRFNSRSEVFLTV